MDDAADPMSLARQRAEKLFLEKASQSWFSAPSCNRFELRFVDGNTKKLAALTFGGMGVVVSDDQYSPVATPVTTVLVDSTLLRSLADVIDDNLPKGAHE